MGVVGRVAREVRETWGENPLSTLRRLASAARLALRREPSSPWLAEKKHVDERFDSQFEVDTGGVTPLSVLRIDSQDRRFGVRHIASDPDELDQALDSLPADVEALTFIDLGSGKGRAVMVAALRPFRRIIGVEFAPRLHDVARQNLDRFFKEVRPCGRVDLVCGDAATFDLPPENLVLFMYNPFGPEVMRKVAARTLASVQAVPRRLYVLYTNPFQAEVWTELGFREIARRHNFLLLIPPGHMSF